MPDRDAALMQMAEGLSYIHKEKWVHRDISPDNILISTTEVSLKISDFGLSKATTDSDTYSFSGNKGTLNFVAPEYMRSEPGDSIKGRPSGDVFALGCVFYYYLTKGTHPFGDPFTVPNNILSGNYNLDSK
jgi:serine/threonine protein kinase